MADCICNTGPSTEGPDEFCPVHGRHCDFNEGTPCGVFIDGGKGHCCRDFDQYARELEVKRLEDSLVDAAMSAVLDPGATTKRGDDYSERMNDWQRRALRQAIRPHLNRFLDAGHQARKAKVIADATEAINYFHDNPDSWAYVMAVNPNLVERLRKVLP